jgi:hypothetical protein
LVFLWPLWYIFTFWYIFPFWFAVPRKKLSAMHLVLKIPNKDIVHFNTSLKRKLHRFGQTYDTKFHLGPFLKTLSNPARNFKPHSSMPRNRRPGITVTRLAEFSPNCLLWAVLWKLQKSHKLLGYFFHVKNYALFWAKKMGWTTFWGNFFTNLSGHLARD